MLLMTINSLKETYGTGTFAIDKVTAEVYSVKDKQVVPIGLQGYPEQEKRPLEGAVGFVPQSASTPKEEEIPVENKCFLHDLLS